jgi:hypothetical protein
MELRAEAEAFSAKNLKLHAEAFRREAYRRFRPRFARRKGPRGKGCHAREMADWGRNKIVYILRGDGLFFWHHE